MNLVNYGNLGMMNHSIENFEGEYDRPYDMVTLTKTDGWVRMRYHSNFTVPPQYLNWVGLNWKLMYLSMGSLWTSAIGVMPQAASGKDEMKGLSYLKYLCSSRDGGLPLLGGQAHRGGAYTRVCN